MTVEAQTLRARYDALVTNGALAADPAQRAALERLQMLLDRLASRQTPPTTGFARLVLARLRRPATPRGVYLWGGVGRGKTMLMDLFFDAAPVEKKRRTHFHAFMLDVQDRLHRARTAASSDDASPVARVAANIAGETRLLCFDEFAVNDIADASILARLFSEMISAGVIVVATSNVEPARLYEGGRNRELFLPFVALLREKLEIVRIEATTDYRAERTPSGEVYYCPADANAGAALDALYLALTGVAHGAPVTIENKRRAIFIPQATGRVARLHFSDICGKPLAAGDYLAIVQRFDATIVEDIPVIAPDRRNEARRLIMLIDVLYEAHALLAISAAAEPDALYRGTPGAETQEFSRAVSRLMEMRSKPYLEACKAWARLTAAPCNP
jgi:cell division protein ZapE